MTLLTDLQAMRTELTGEIDGDSPANDAKVTRWIDCVDRAMGMIQAGEGLAATVDEAIRNGFKP